MTPIENDLTPLERRARDGLEAAIALAHATALEAGWYRNPATGEPIKRNFGEVIALMHSELSEALEADRKSLADDHLPHRSGVEVELADCIIRIFDTAAALGLDLAGALIEKNRFNRERADHKLAARAAGGKRYLPAMTQRIKPIIFSTPMIRALIEGRTSQTRRLAKFHVRDLNTNLAFSGVRAEPLRPGMWALVSRGRGGCFEERAQVRVPYAPDDLLWVRETWAMPHGFDLADAQMTLADKGCRPMYRATDNPNSYSYRPSIFMPRWASRLTLEVTAVKVEQLQDISAADVEAEGVEYAIRPFGDWKLIPGIWDLSALETGEQATEPPPAIKYAYLWNTINGEPGKRWADNPWIVAVSFNVHKTNVDAFLKQREAA